jgi:hypothetical protein
VASVGGANAPERDERLVLAVNVQHIHWFSAGTGERLPDGR